MQKPRIITHWSSDPERIAALAQQILVTRQLEELLHAFNKAGIDTILLKGTAFWNWLYEPGERPVSDIDMLVRQRDYKRAQSILSSSGYVRIRDDSRPVTARELYEAGFMPVGKMGQAYVELHTCISHPVRYDFDIEDMFQSSQELNIGQARAFRLSPEYNLVHLAIHRTIHGFGFDTDLRNIEDADLIVKNGKPDWDRLLNIADGMGCKRALWILLDSAQKRHDTYVQSWFMEAIEPDMLISRYISCVMRPEQGVWVFKWQEMADWKRRLVVFPLALDRPGQFLRSLIYYTDLRVRDLLEAHGLISPPAFRDLSS